MSFKTSLLGKEGEELALGFLKAQGYRIKERNFKNKLGEIDIVAQDKDTICFIEVKTRTSEDFGGPLEAVIQRKQRKLSQLALSYLKSKNLLNEKARFDVVSLIKNEDGAPEISLLKDAFELSSPYAY